jgi:hypothetical protein
MRTLPKRFTITSLIGLVCVIVSVSCQSSLSPTPTLTASPISSPTDIILADTPTSSSPTTEPTGTPVLISCIWIPYLNHLPLSHLSDENCLNDLGNIGISGDTKQITFFVDGASTGSYGVCQDISKRDKLKFSVRVRDSIASARFLVTISPNPIPIKTSARGFKIQAEKQDHLEKEIYVKFIEYVSEHDGYDKDIDKIQSILDWKHVDYWNFDFVFQFSSSKINASMNKALFEQWQLNSSTRYLCFAYQATPNAVQATELEARVVLP